ncbi:hypothetical protein RHGRI_037182 [Rhododendron griersonianum]|uniref:Uncharacterized protein n=1 Tax=Rhododendron griersonianum TaxID=479676 RepID=A0AAV6HUT1_9ERIC|nr:hypothetical protein RHGRI_037182 [Rhododendron griersonianum]
MGFVSGSKFYYLKNEAVLLEMAFINWTITELMRRGFTPLITPEIVRSSVVEKCGFQPRGENTQYFREDLHRRLLSTDFKMQVDGIEMLHKVLEFLPEFFDMLRIEWYTLTKSEAAIFLPCLVEKVIASLPAANLLPVLLVDAKLSGHNIEKVREKNARISKTSNLYNILREECKRCQKNIRFL